MALLHLCSPCHVCTRTKPSQERLLAEGFGDWTKKDFRAFISACEKYGRKNLDAIVTEVSEL